MADQQIKSNNPVQENNVHPAWYVGGAMVGVGAVSDGIGSAKRANRQRRFNKASKDYENRLQHEARNLLHSDLYGSDSDYTQAYDKVANTKKAFRKNPNPKKVTEQYWQDLEPEQGHGGGRAEYAKRAKENLSSKGYSQPTKRTYDDYLKTVDGQLSHHPTKSSILRRMLRR